MKIQVTQEDIEMGSRGNAFACPIAIAAERVFPEAFVTVSPEHLRLYGTGTLTSIPLPESATEFISRFDEAEEVSPFEFEIEA